MPSAELKVHDGAVRYAMQRLPKVLHREFKRELFWMLKGHRKEVGRAFGSRTPAKRRAAERWVTSQIAQYRRGDTLATLLGGSFTRSRALEAHQEGRVITPQKGGEMFIPIADALTATGRLKKRYKVRRDGLPPAFSLKAAHNVQVIKMRGRTFAVIPDEEQGGIKELIAVGVKRTHLDPRLDFFGAWDRLLAKRQKALNKAVNRTLKAIGDRGKRP